MLTTYLLGENLPYKLLVDDRTALLGGAFELGAPIRPYSPLPLKWAWDQLIRYPKAVLLDVGASTGCYSLLAKCHPDLTVYSFEPVALTYAVLKENIYLNELAAKVHTYNMGVSDYVGTGTLHTVIADGGKGVSIVDGRPAYHKATAESTIEVTTIDAFCEQNNVAPTMLKIDVEGNEKAVLRGAKKTIEKYHPFILTEYSWENAEQFEGGVNEIVVMLEEWGYAWLNPEGTDLWAVPIGWEKITNVQHMEIKTE